MLFFSALRAGFVDFTSENSNILEFSFTIIAYFSALRAENTKSNQGAPIFLAFSKSEYFWGALIIFGKSPKKAGGR